MKILHAPINIAGGAHLLAQAQRKLGYEAYSYTFKKGFSSDQIDIAPPSTSWLSKTKMAIKLGREFDTFQFWFGTSLMGASLSDLPLLAKLGKKIFFYFCGCDVRDEKQTLLKYPVSACMDCFPKLCSPNRLQALNAAKEFSRATFVSTPDLLEFVKGSIHLPQPVDFETIHAVLDSERPALPTDRLVVAHAPTSRALKGTKYLLEAVSNLKKSGVPIEIKLIENLPHKQALREYYGAHVAVDQLLFGSYGALSAEMMALGVPTVVYLRPDVQKLYPEKPPLILAEPATIERTLLDIYEGKFDLNKYAAQGREFAFRHHDPMTLGRTCLDYYLN